MVERKAKSTVKKSATVVKKAAAIQTGSAVSGKSKPAPATVATAAKKVVEKKAVAAEPKKTRTPAVKKDIAPVADKKTPVRKVAAAKAKPEADKQKAVQPTPEERYRMVQTAAYFIAERNGFQGCSTEHWAAAEAEIASRLGC